LKLLSNKKLYWSKQHGAYISLIAAWLIANILNGFNGIQVVAIIFLLSGLNFVELMSERIFRKSPLPKNKKTWFYIYGATIDVTGILLSFYSESFPYILLALIIGSAGYLILFKARLQKSILAEWVIFLLISIAAFCGLQQVVWSDIFPAIGALTLFLGSSIFTVKARLEKISVTPVLVYTAFSVALLLFYFSFNTFSIILSLLIILKTSGIWLFPEKFKAIPIRKIGILEAIFQMLLIVDFYFFY
jgi:hypothetical protein